MKVKWTGKTPVCNEFGDWKPGEIKDLPENSMLGVRNIALGFHLADENSIIYSHEFPAKIKKVRKRRTREALQDKFERDSIEVREKKEEN